MSRCALLDVNLLVALFDQDHVHHDLAHDWFADNHARGWATCAVTENGFVRVLSNPAYGSAVSRPSELVARLRKFCASSDHQFWTDAVSLRDEALFDCAAPVTGSSQTCICWPCTKEERLQKQERLLLSRDALSCSASLCPES